MKLKIKTLNQKTLVIDIEETKTVYELKKELSLYPDIGVKPEQQKLIYAGKFLQNEDKLCACNIDEKKFLVIMIVKQPTFEPLNLAGLKQSHSNKEEESKAAAGRIGPTASVMSSPTESEDEFKTPKEPDDNRKEALVRLIVGMGYPAPEVRKALVASFYNPERAIEYLVDGIPTTSTSGCDTDADLSMTPFEVFRSDPGFKRLRSALQQHPELLDAAIQKIGQTNPFLLNLINENQKEFLSTLLANSGNEEDDEAKMDDEED